MNSRLTVSEVPSSKRLKLFTVRQDSAPHTFKILLRRQHATLHAPAAPLHQKNNFEYGYCEACLLCFDSYFVPLGAFKIFLEEAIYRHGSLCPEDPHQAPCPISNATCGWQHSGKEGVDAYMPRNNNINYF